MKKLMGIAQVLLSGICFGFLGIFARLAYQNQMSVGELLTFRFTIASILLWCFLLFLNRKLIRLPLRQIITSMFLGIFGYAIFSTLYFESIKGISVPLAAMLLFTFPLFVNAGAFFFLKEPLSKEQIVGLFVGSFGLVLLLWGDFTVEKTSSIFFGLGAAICYSIYVLVSGKLQKDVEPLSSSLYVMTAATITLFLFHQPSPQKLLVYETQQWLILFGIAVFSTIAPMTLFLAGLQKMTSSKASILVMIEPVTAALAAWFILHEEMTLLQICGALFVLGGIFLSFALPTQTNRTIQPLS